MPSERPADEEAVVKFGELLSADLALFAAVRSAYVVGSYRRLLVVMCDDLLRYYRRFVKMPDAVVNDLLIGVGVAGAYRIRIPVPSAGSCRIQRGIIILAEVWFFEAERAAAYQRVSLYSSTPCSHRSLRTWRSPSHLAR